MIVVILLAIVLIGYLAWKMFLEKPPEKPKIAKEVKLPRMANLPPPEKTPVEPPEPSYTPTAPLLQDARKALSEGIDPAAAVAMAKSLAEGPERADAAFLLLEYAADNGNAEGAFVVARYYDPTDKVPSGTIRKNPATAYEWYQEALAGGQSESTTHLARLRKWVVKQAQGGSAEARDLLKDWR
jgi:hypothetical protein